MEESSGCTVHRTTTRSGACGASTERVCCYGTGPVAAAAKSTDAILYRYIQHSTPAMRRRPPIYGRSLSGGSSVPSLPDQLVYVWYVRTKKKQDRVASGDRSLSICEACVRESSSARPGGAHHSCLMATRQRQADEAAFPWDGPSGCLLVFLFFVPVRTRAICGLLPRP